MSSILGPIQKLGTVLTGLTSDTGEVIQRQFTATPQQPQPADFPALIIEVDPEREGSFDDVQGGAHNTYPINIMILVGAAATTQLPVLHNRACAWVYPLGVRLFSNIKLSAVDNVLMVGYGGVGGGPGVFKYHVQGIMWGDKQYYGLRATTWIKECMALAMA